MNESGLRVTFLLADCQITSPARFRFDDNAYALSTGTRGEESNPTGDDTIPLNTTIARFLNITNINFSGFGGGGVEVAAPRRIDALRLYNVASDRTPNSTEAPPSLETVVSIRSHAWGAAPLHIRISGNAFGQNSVLRFIGALPPASSLVINNNRFVSLLPDAAALVFPSFASLSSFVLHPNGECTPQILVTRNIDDGPYGIDFVGGTVVEISNNDHALDSTSDPMRYLIAAAVFTGGAQSAGSSNNSSQGYVPLPLRILDSSSMTIANNVITVGSEGFYIPMFSPLPMLACAFVATPAGLGAGSVVNGYSSLSLRHNVVDFAGRWLLQSGPDTVAVATRQE